MGYNYIYKHVYANVSSSSTHVGAPVACRSGTDYDTTSGFDMQIDGELSEEDSACSGPVLPADCDGSDDEQFVLPVAPKRSRLQDNLAEYFSPPRLVPVAQARGLRASLSVDLATGWDLASKLQSELALDALTSRQIKFLMLSPPCTMFSALQELWNIKRMIVAQ